MCTLVSRLNEITDVWRPNRIIIGLQIIFIDSTAQEVVSGGSLLELFSFLERN